MLPVMVKKRRRYPVREKLAKLTKNEEVKVSYIKRNGGGCSVCGYSACSNALVIHQLDTSTKSFNLSMIRRKIGDYGKQAVTKEIEKCVLLCHNCHSEVHYKETRENLKKLLKEENNGCT